MDFIKNMIASHMQDVLMSQMGMGKKSEEASHPSRTGSSMPADMPNLQETTANMNSTQLQGYLHQASKIMEQASNNSMVSKSAYSSWVEKANDILRTMDQHMGGGGPKTTQELATHPMSGTEEFRQGAEVASRLHGSMIGGLGQGGAGGVSGGAYSQGGGVSGGGHAHGGATSGGVFSQGGGGMSGAGYPQVGGNTGGGYSQNAQGGYGNLQQSHGQYDESQGGVGPQGGGAGGYGTQTQRPTQGYTRGLAPESDAGGYSNQGAGGFGNQGTAPGGYGGNTGAGGYGQGGGGVVRRVWGE